MINKRKHQRFFMQQTARSGLLNDNLVLNNRPRIQHRPVLSNISFGGMGLIFIPELNKETADLLQAGKNNIYLEFFLPPSINSMNVTGKVKWHYLKRINQSIYSTVGIEYVTKTQELYREIDKFLKSASPSSELYKNQRFFPRIHSEIKTQFTIPGVTKFLVLPKYFEGTISNISVLGVKLKISPPLNQKDTNLLKEHSGFINLRFFLPSVKHMFTMKCRVIHVHNVQSGKSHQTMIGLKFIDVNDKDRMLLIEYTSVKRSMFLKQEMQQGNIV
ncbi:MAG: hypothetical protein ACD_79C01465G0002 [uncultured bacterium]|nr:MAG: hypothetical protein ACD_79C01465G0002 [uncultured bacterium]